jgi:hydrogenase maturation protein HypF
MSTMATAAHSLELRVRRGIRVRGTVQGVGFRPAVFRAATARDLAGFVRNDSEGVWIEVEGPAGALSRFLEDLPGAAPPLARIEATEIVELRAVGELGFRIAASAERPSVRASVPPDAATCDACLRELFDPADRRFRYPFINCTDCGPRYTIARDVPYDRARTTMAAFILCARCRAEYEDPSSRRFHAEPNACPDCGPVLSVPSAGLRGEAALGAAVAALRAGRIAAVKGLGGFHLAVDARDQAAVVRLRERKQRPHKPFALMARDLQQIEALVELDEPARRALASPLRPIVICPTRGGAAVAPAVAPGLDELGVMLPYTPLHHLLLRDGPELLVMTSGNLAEEPIAKDNPAALERLAGIADVFLLHDREIHTRADDSVVRMVAGKAQPVRRSRGHVPDPIELGFTAPPVLAVGANLKNTVCMTRGGDAYLSPHVGDLDHLEAFAYFREVIEKLAQLLGVRPEVVACDLHPDYVSTRWALESGLRKEPVQHHHAHVASCLAEHGRSGPCLGVAFDGTGCGPAGELWGGEFLLADLAGFQRLGHLRPLALAGGEAAIREPWRLAAAALHDAGLNLELLGRIDRKKREAVLRLIETGAASPKATGAGRWFDAVAALCGLRDEITYEGQAAVELEAIAAPGDCCSYPFRIERGDPFVVDLRPAVRAIGAELANGAPAGEVAARFHRTLAMAIGAGCRIARERSRVETVALSGGCFQNRLLSESAKRLLEQDGFDVLVHGRVPPNDGGVALGQAAVAAWRSRQLNGGNDVPRHSR